MHLMGISFTFKYKKMKKNNLLFAFLLFTVAAVWTSCKKGSTANGNCATCLSCINTVLEIDSAFTGSIVNSGPLKPTTFSTQDSFRLLNGNVLYNQRIFKTNDGFYTDVDAFCVKINLNNLLPGQLPSKLSFTHAHSGQVPYLVNIKLDNNPLLVTTADSLDFYLSPLGYTIQYFAPATSWQHNSGSFSPGFADSVIITSPSPLQNITLGVQLGKSEIRNICFHN